ncbi:hypothetical protein ASG40_12825 [Methylobacterium sp. Leaf399]|uniref:hypothetical protein n=1 Tax=unclassified Methylobacterium TaxID=2615210 RepID=UPI0006F5B3F0|nr:MULTISPECIES: hypothetical protein [unclassified Methylobacterium]KQP50807.1 hypothetical protein ASF39_11205 [Methylobacterium sp. Leaf108]KQT07787.1 hypothetical protein ASG40_12825 [Methylobacterium sp. Leaf399]
MSVLLAATGFPGPYVVRSSSEAVIVDAQGRPVAIVLPVFADPAVRMWLAEFMAAAVNAAAGFPAPPIEAPLDPRHLAAVHGTTRAFVRRASPGPLSDAAE